jgi:hypothetical protein
VWERCNVKNEHSMLAVVGREGMGKSHTALRIGELVDPGFSADRVMFSAERFVERFQDSSLGAGDVVVLDEAGVDLGNRSWYEDDQINLNKILQTVRDDNMTAIFTLPALEELDTQTENRLLAYLELLEKKEGDFVRGKFKRLKIDRGPKRKGTYEKYPRRLREGRKQMIQSIAFTPPTQDLVEAYEQRKAQFKQSLYDDLLGSEGDEEGQTEEPDDPRDVADKIVENEQVSEYVFEHAQNGTKYLDSDLIAADWDIPKTQAGTVKSLLQRRVDLQETSAANDRQRGAGD